MTGYGKDNHLILYLIHALNIAEHVPLTYTLFIVQCRTCPLIATWQPRLTSLIRQPFFQHLK